MTPLLLLLRQESPTAAAAAAAGRRRRGDDRLQDGLLALAAPLGRRGVVEDDGAAAGRAGGVGAQPGVDAVDVEPVAALRHHAHLLPLAELRQADGALRQDPVLPLLLLAPRHGAPRRRRRGHRVRVRQLRQRLERLLLEPLAGGRHAAPRRACRRSSCSTMVMPTAAPAEGRQGVGRAAGRRGLVGVGVGVAAGARAPRDGGEADYADERAEQGGEDDDDIRADAGGRIGRGDARDAAGVAALEETPRRIRRWPEHRPRSSSAGSWRGLFRKIKVVARRERSERGWWYWQVAIVNGGRVSVVAKLPWRFPAGWGPVSSTSWTIPKGPRGRARIIRD